MSSDMNREDKDVLAAEFAMGLSEGDDLMRAEKMLRDDEEFAQMHARWRERLVEVDATAQAQPVDDSLWARIQTALPQAQPEIGRRMAAAPTLSERISGLWSNLNFWRPAGLVAAMASLVLAIGLGFATREVARQPVLVAVLMTDGNQAGAIVNVHADGRAELVPLGDIPVPPGRALQIWTLWDRVRGPVSVGLSRSARRLDLDLQALPRTVPTQLFEITLEPEAGSPTGRPTGPILMKGNATTAL